MDCVSVLLYPSHSSYSLPPVYHFHTISFSSLSLFALTFLSYALWFQSFEFQKVTVSMPANFKKKSYKYPSTSRPCILATIQFISDMTYVLLTIIKPCSYLLKYHSSFVFSYVVIILHIHRFHGRRSVSHVVFLGSVPIFFLQRHLLDDVFSTCSICFTFFYTSNISPPLLL